MGIPAHYEQASPIRRYIAGGINFLVVGLCTVAAEASAYALAASEGKLANVRLSLLGLVTLYWLACVLKRKSLGGAFCLLEVRADGFKPLSVRSSFLRTLPFYTAAVVAYAPISAVPFAVAEIRAFLLVILGIALAVDAVVLALSGRSVFDRLLKVGVWRLNHPDRLRPRIFGQRIV